MQWPGETQTFATAAAGAMTRVATAQPTWQVRYIGPAALVLALAGLAILVPALAPRTFFDLLLAPLLVVALSLGFLPALVCIAVGVLACTFGIPLVGAALADVPVHLAALAPHVGQAIAIAGVASVVRVALRSAATTFHERSWSPPEQSEPVGPWRVERLTPREVEVLRAAAGGGGFDELATRLALSRNTVKTHLAHCYDKLGAHNRAEAIVLAVHAGVLHPQDLERAANFVEGDEVFRNHPTG